ncbi:MAG: MmgE/PrpD family protein [Candidatus Bathyarchaeia archaeon]
MGEVGNISETIAQYIAETSYGVLPQEVVHVTKACILDTLGVMLAANTLGEGVTEIVDLVLRWGGKEESTVVGYGIKVPAPLAALANGAMAHALDYEETYDQARVHPSAATVPAAFAVAESQPKVSGKDVILAIALGNEIVIRAGRAVDKSRPGPWFTPPILGGLGAVVAAGKILGLSPQEILSAFSLLLFQLSASNELLRSKGSVIRAIREAFVAKAGVLSAILASRGLKGFERPLDGEGGFFSMYFHNEWDEKELIDELGQKFMGISTSFKLWPSCRGTHPYIEAAIRILDKCKGVLEVERVKAIRALISPANTMLCEPITLRLNPSTAIEAKFSLPFVVVLTLVKGGIKLEDFHELDVWKNDPRFKMLTSKFFYHVEPSLNPVEGILEITMVDGEKVQEAVKFPKGSPGNPLSEKELRDKFVENGKYAYKKFTQAHLERLADAVLALDHLEDIRAITKLL